MMNISKIGILILFTILYLNLGRVYAQSTTPVDSLLNLLQYQTTDTGKISILLDISDAYRIRRLPEAEKYANEALQLSEKCKNLPGVAKSYRFLSNAAFITGDYNRSFTYLKSSLKISNSIHDETGVANCYKRMGLILAYQNEYDSAIVYYQKALDIFDKSGNMGFASECYNDLGVLYNYQGDHEKSMEYQQKSLELCRQIGDKKAIASRLINIGAAYADQSNYHAAIKYYNDALIIKTESDDKRGISMCLNNLGEVYKMQGDFGKAIEFYEKSLEIDTGLEDQEGMAITLLNIGEVHAKQHDIDKSTVYFNKSLAIASLIDNKRISANVSNLRGEMLMNAGRYQDALKDFKQSSDFSKLVGDQSEMAKSVYLMGKTFMAQKNFNDAIASFQQAFNLHTELGETGETANDYIMMGKASFESLDADKAIELYLKGLDIARDIGSKESERSAAELLSQAYFYQKNYLKAYQYHILFKQTHDSIFTLESKKQIAEVETRFQLERNQQQIELQNIKLEKQAAEIRQQHIRQIALIIIILIGSIVVIVIIIGYLRIKDAKNIISKQMLQIRENNEELNQINEELNVTIEANTYQKQQIEKKNKEITDSINYARHIQRAVLPSQETMLKLLPHHFVLMKPKDIISGDFYWVTQVKNHIILAVADCTGHGVPGAFMSMLGISLLNELVNKEQLVQTHEILSLMRKEIIHVLNQKGTVGELRDGIAIGLCSIDLITKQLQFSGANSPFYLVRQADKPSIPETRSVGTNNYILYEIEGDNMPIAISGKMDHFQVFTIDLQKGDFIYLFSDGFADQFGGTEGKRFRYSPFKELILANCDKPLHDQKNILEKTFKTWQGHHDQIDDVLVLGLIIE